MRSGALVVAALLGGLVASGDASADIWGPADRNAKWQQHCEQALAERIPPQIAGEVSHVRVDWNRVEATQTGGEGALKGEGVMKLNGHDARFLFQCNSDVHSGKVQDMHFRMK